MEIWKCGNETPGVTWTSPKMWKYEDVKSGISCDYEEWCTKRNHTSKNHTSDILL